MNYTKANRAIKLSTIDIDDIDDLTNKFEETLDGEYMEPIYNGLSLQGQIINNLRQLVIDNSVNMSTDEYVDVINSLITLENKIRDIRHRFTLTVDVRNISVNRKTD